MRLPELTAGTARGPSTSHHAAGTAGVLPGGGVRPQAVLPPWTPCRWLFFCCTEFGDRSCCRRWHLQCTPE
jgi:hypothetical protein